MLTRKQKQLIRKLENFSVSPFAPSLIDNDSKEYPFFIVSDDEYNTWLNIDASETLHLNHIRVYTLSPSLSIQDNVSNFLLDTPIAS